MALTVAAVLTRAQDILQDVTGVRWPQAELLRWINDGRRELAIARPDIYAANVLVTLVQGTRQTIPASATRFLDAVRNVHSVDDTPRQSIRVVEREVLDAQVPDWHTQTPTTLLKHFAFDERSPRVFYTYPPAVAGHKLEIVVSQSPVEVEINDELVAEDIYTGALVNYICAQAFSKDAEFAGNEGRAMKHYAAFQGALSLGRAQDYVASPNTSNMGGMPPRSGIAAKQA
jgi:hypothetical protein